MPDNAPDMPATAGKLLIDTSAWIVSFRRAGNEKLKERIVHALESSTALTTNVVILELLQGCRDRKEFESMKARLEAMDVLAINADVWRTAYDAGYALRRAGITVPTVDIVIASIAKVYGCALLHHDSHFRLIAGKLDIQAVDFLGRG